MCLYLFGNANTTKGLHQYTINRVQDVVVWGASDCLSCSVNIEIVCDSHFDCQVSIKFHIDDKSLWTWGFLFQFAAAWLHRFMGAGGVGAQVRGKSCKLLMTYEDKKQIHLRCYDWEKSSS